VILPVGHVCLTLLGQKRRIFGGPFDAYVPPAIGVCLEARSIRADDADILIPVADFQPPSQVQLVDALVRLVALARARPSEDIYVGCRAGMGRTGTFIASIARLAGIEDAVWWTRANYHPNAVETPAQEACVAALDVQAVWHAIARGTQPNG
jgi:hypothetical protein